MTGTLDTVERPDGSLQVTYNGQPLYLNIRDLKPGDTFGQARNDNFFVVPVSGPPPTFSVHGEDSSGASTVELIEDPDLGTILVDSEGMTLYQSMADDDGTSHCYGNCAKYWPPLTVPEDRRFFILKWMMDPHSPYNPPEHFRGEISVDPGKLSRPVEKYSRSHFWRNWRGNWMPGPKMSADEIGFVRALYTKEVESVDERVGYVLAALRKSGRLDKTYIVFTSDHGESFGEHGRFGHGHSYSEELLHVPLIIFGPGLPRGKRIPDRVSLLGLMPTFMELLGVPLVETVQGRSFTPLIQDEEMEPRPQYFFGSTRAEHDKDALLHGDYKLIAHQIKDQFSLYHLPSDPGELNNLAAREPHVVRRLLAELIRLRKENTKRLKMNTEGNRLLNTLSVSEREKIIEKLRTLGYID